MIRVEYFVAVGLFAAGWISAQIFRLPDGWLDIGVKLASIVGGGATFAAALFAYRAYKAWTKPVMLSKFDELMLSIDCLQPLVRDWHSVYSSMRDYFHDSGDFTDYKMLLAKVPNISTKLMCAHVEYIHMVATWPVDGEQRKKVMDMISENCNQFLLRENIKQPLVQYMNDPSESNRALALEVVEKECARLDELSHYSLKTSLVNWLVDFNR